MSTFAVPNRDWDERAACRDRDPLAFDTDGIRTAKRAIAICNTCPVQPQCLLEAVLEESRTRFGPYLVRGGKTVTDRRHIRNGPARERRALISQLENQIRQQQGEP